MGIVSRRDLLSVFLRPDIEAADDVRELLDDLLPSDPASVTATVRNGVVVLTGSPEAPEDRQLIPVAIRLIWDVDGVIDVDNRLGRHPGADSSGTQPHSRPPPHHPVSCARTPPNSTPRPGRPVGPSVPYRGKRTLSNPVTFLEDDVRTRTGFLVARIGRPAREPT